MVVTPGMRRAPPHRVAVAAALIVTYSLALSPIDTVDTPARTAQPPRCYLAAVPMRMDVLWPDGFDQKTGGPAWVVPFPRPILLYGLHCL